ncbi:dienelactone hydrolase family protein [Chelatococcus reniformis]|uniref:Carboxymethylenebutenolidase n=1 Tax=Chelatococcus reniformis TaxID=1494448 RepID=A0A916UB17_9HYPH|nr:dienelactone hydrolase family protein [Chelatococcus reniformis]GGC66885.1 carboxymethylenebutenolidase [Chelatococcus reniformis]
MSQTDDLEGLRGLINEPLSRRGFVMTALMSGFTVATAHAQAGQAIQTPADGLVAGEVKIKVADGDMPAYRAMPQGGGPFPIVLVVEEIFGVHEYIKDTCRRLAKLGYVAIAPELYARQGDISKVTDVQQILRDFIAKTPDSQVMSDLDAAAKWAVADSKGDPKRLGITGFCRGGRAVWLYAAHNPDVKAAVAWYGPLAGQTTPIQPKTAADVAGDIKVPVLGLYGGADPGIPVAAVEAQRDKAKAAGKTVEIVIFPQAGHAFHADYRPSYNKQAAEDGWQRMLAWFKTYGVA